MQEKKKFEQQRFEKSCYIKNKDKNYPDKIPVQRKEFISDLEYLYLIVFSGRKFFVKCVYKAGMYLKFFVSDLISDQILAKSKQFLARKKLS